MVQFIGKTWFLWWALAVVVILRWFSVVSADFESEILDSSFHDQPESDVVCGGLTSRA